MKRPPGLWLLLSAGVLWLCFQDVSCVRATSLIFGKSTTSTTLAPSSEATHDEESVTEVSPDVANTTKSLLSGIPQQDYLFDPNLPRELNGYNLTEYPFFSTVPEADLIAFKCDGLHDGFYASIEYKCQVYHHCIDGTRYDFLCANYTAFDQKTFICHFVSEVDCVNSKNFWHRNDNLYIALTTTTVKPLIIYKYDRPSAPHSALSGNRRPLGGASKRRRPMRRRRPQYDYYDEEEEEIDDYYEEPRYTATEATRSESRRRKRPRPRPRPVYEDEYDEYEDERLERRGGSRRDEASKREESGSRREEDRRPYKRPTTGRNKDERRKYEDEYEDDEEDPRFDRSEARKNKRPKDDRRNEERKSTTTTEKIERRREKHRDDDEEEEPRYKRPKKPHRRPYDDEYEDEPKEERRSNNKKNSEESGRSKEDIPALPEDKPIILPKSGSSVYDRPRVAPRIKPPVPKTEADKYNFKTAIIKPTPKPVDEEEYYEEYEDEAPKRTPPKTKLEEEEPPKRVSSRGKASEEEPIKRTTPKSKEDEEEEELIKPERVLPSRAKADPGKGTSSSSRQANKDSRDRERDNRKPSPSESRPRGGSSARKPIEDDYEYEEERPRRKNPKNEERRVGQGSRKRPAMEEYEDDYETPDKRVPLNNRFKDRKRVKEEIKPRTISTTSTTTTTTSTTTTTQAPPKEETSKQSVRIVKRPFLPSRGGNPYLARGLQPLGVKATTQEPVRSEAIKEDSKEVQSSVESRKEQKDATDSRGLHKYLRRPEDPKSTEDNKAAEKLEEGDSKEFFKPSPVVIKVPGRSKANPFEENEYRPTGNRPLRTQFKQSLKESDSRITQKPKLVDKNPLDINENEYDVTLNDALNPTLPNLPVRSFPTGFSAANDYTFSAFHRPRYVVDATINQASSEYNYRYKPQPLRYENAQSNNNYNTNIGRNDQTYNAQASYSNNGQNYQNFRPSPRVAAQSQSQVQQFFTTY